MAPDARADLARRQAELVRALTGDAPAPAGFDHDRLRRAAEALAVKRRRSVRAACPELATALGPRFVERFAAYAGAAPAPRDGGARADARAFAAAVEAEEDLPDVARLEVLAIDLRHARSPGGLVPRHGPSLATAHLKGSRRLVVAIRLPGVGERWWSLPIGRPR